MVRPVHANETQEEGGAQVPHWAMVYLDKHEGPIHECRTAGFLYPDFMPFRVAEIEMLLGLFIFNGLSPSPRIDQKFKSQWDDPVQGNDFIADLFGPNCLRRLKHFKAFFLV